MGVRCGEFAQQKLPWSGHKRAFEVHPVVEFLNVWNDPAADRRGNPGLTVGRPASISEDWTGACGRLLNNMMIII
jgi:hypothetical protein